MQQPLEVLKKYWGYPAFRPLQEDIIRAVLDGRDTLALLPTGGGKSICFQVPTLCLEGICIVVTPLIALMKDQVGQLQKRGIRATAIYSGMSKREVDITLDNCVYGDYKFLYVSPERLKSELFIERAQRMNIALMAVDEAHCISQWGYDFRPPYLEIATFKNQLSIPRIIALTATATREVKQDIMEKLEMKAPAFFKKSFARENLSYSAFNLENKEQKLVEILRNVPGSSVVYVRSRKGTKNYAEYLQRQGISAAFYHAGLSGKVRDQRQQDWINNNVRVIVSTNAFGMGIDKPDVRTVIHMDLPDTLEAYYQEAGRAGRDERSAYAIALHSDADFHNLTERVKKATVSLETLKTVYQALCNNYQLAIGSLPVEHLPFDLNVFCKKYNLEPIAAFQALKKLDQEGLIQVNEAFYDQSRMMVLMEKAELYKYQVAHPKFDALIKVCLRLYGGELMLQYAKIAEADIAKLCKEPLGEVKRQLQYLTQQEVIDYQSPQEGQSISFLTPRVDAAELPVDHKRMKERASLALAKAREVIKYLRTSKCRSLFLQAYFDEHSEQECGVCDNDLAKKKRAGGVPERLLLELLDEPKGMDQLRRELRQFSSDAIMMTLRVLLGDEKISEKNGQFQRVK